MPATQHGLWSRILSVEPMTRLHKATGTVILLIVLAGVIWLGNANLGLTALVGVAALTASQAAGATLTNLLAGLTLRSEGHIRIGVTITVPGPSGAITGEVVAIEARVTLVKDDQGGIAPVPNSTLTSSTPYIQAPPSNSIPEPPPPPGVLPTP